MEFQGYFVVLLKKGPPWTPESTPELDALQERHLAHLGSMAEAGKLAIAGPVEMLSDGDIRGISILYRDAFTTVAELKAMVEADPVFEIGRLVADYMKWYFPKGVSLGQAEP